MADRVVRVVTDGRRRRIGFGTGLALATALLVMIASGVFAAAPSAHTVRAKAAATSKTGGQTDVQRRAADGPDVEHGGVEQRAVNYRAVKYGAVELHADVSRADHPDSPREPHPGADQRQGELAAVEDDGRRPARQLEMAGPNGANGSPGDLIYEGSEREDRLGAGPRRRQPDQPDPVRGAAVTAAHPTDLRARRDPRLQDDVPVLLGEVASWNPPLVENDESVSASEATADGIK